MDSTTSPHCIPSPPIFSLDVRNLGHLCFEELPEAATAVEAKTIHFSVTHNHLNEKDKSAQSMSGAPPVTFLPIDQKSSEANRNSVPDDYHHSSGRDDDIFDEIFSTFEDILSDDQPSQKPCNAALYASVKLGDAPLPDGSTSLHNHSDPYAPIPIESSSESGSGLTTVDSTRSSSPAAEIYEDPQHDGNTYSQSYHDRATNESGEIASETLESCLHALHQHHNNHEKKGVADPMEGFINKFGNLKPQTADPREHMARAALLAQQSGKLSKEEVDSTPPSVLDSSNIEREHPINRTDELTIVGGKSVKLPVGVSSEDTKRARTQPMTPAVLVNTLPLSSQSSTENAPEASQKVKRADAMAGLQPSATSTDLNTSTSASTSKDFSDIPIAARALPLLPTSLESFRSQLSKSKKNNVSKKKQLPLPVTSSATKTPSTASPAKKDSQVQKSKKSKVLSSVPSANTRPSEYNLSEYFSSEEISGLLSVMCSDDECEGDRDGNVDITGRATDHVMLSPHVDSGGAFFSFGTGGYGTGISSHTSASTGSGGVGNSASMMSIPPEKSVRKRKVETESVVDPAVKKPSGSLRPTGRSSTAMSNSSYVHTPLSPATRKPSSPHIGVNYHNYVSESQVNGNTGYDTSMRMNVDEGDQLRKVVTDRRDPYALSKETQRKIAEDSEKVLRMQTDKILQDNHKRQLSQGKGAVDSVPSLLSSLGSVGGSITHLQGLAGLSSVLHGGGSGIPSLSPMYTAAASSLLSTTSSPAVGVSQGFVQTTPSPHASMLIQPQTHVQAGAPPSGIPPENSIAPPTLLGGMQQHPQQHVQFPLQPHMYQVHSSPHQHQQQHQHFK